MAGPCGWGTSLPRSRPPVTICPRRSTSSSAPKNANITLVAQNATFETDCIAAPADQPITIAFDNKDPSVPHNVSIYTDESAKKALFTGDMVTGPKKITYDVGTLPAGTYFFRCDVHPTTMTGTLTVS